MFTTIPTKEYAKEKTKTSNIPVGRAGVWKLPTKWFPLGGGSAIYCNYRVTWIGFWSNIQGSVWWFFVKFEVFCNEYHKIMSWIHDWIPSRVKSSVLTFINEFHQKSRVQFKVEFRRTDICWLSQMGTLGGHLMFGGEGMSCATRKDSRHMIAHDTVDGRKPLGIFLKP